MWEDLDEKCIFEKVCGDIYQNVMDIKTIKEIKEDIMKLIDSTGIQITKSGIKIIIKQYFEKKLKDK